MAKRTLNEYIAATRPASHHQKAGEKVATRSPNPMSAGWAWNPDKATQRQISRSNRKMRLLKKAKLESKMGEADMATKKAKGKTTAKKVTKKTTSNLIPLKKICQDLKLDPKMARRTLRSSKSMMKIHEASGRWEFTESQAKKVRDVLKAD